MVHDWRYFGKAVWAQAKPNHLEQMSGSYFSELSTAKPQRFNVAAETWAELVEKASRFEFVQDHSEHHLIWKTIHPLDQDVAELK